MCIRVSCPADEDTTTIAAVMISRVVLRRVHPHVIILLGLLINAVWRLLLLILQVLLVLIVEAHLVEGHLVLASECRLIRG